MEIQIFFLIVLLILAFCFIFVYLKEKIDNHIRNKGFNIPEVTVTCADCGCEVKIDNAYVVNGFSYKLYYCKKDKKNYDMIYEFPDYSSGKMITRSRYYKKTDFIEVTKDGEPVGYKKK